jgi:hypothetical protein
MTWCHTPKVLIEGLIVIKEKGELHPAARQLSWKKELLWSKWESFVLLWHLLEQVIRIQI